MTLTTTAGSASADSYATLAATDAYFSARGVTTWTGDDADKEAALRRATSYLDRQYSGLWKGIRVAETQALAWPRYNVVDPDGFTVDSTTVPAAVATAAMEAALLVLTGVDLEPRLVRGGRVKQVQKRVGPLSTSTTYMDGATARDRLLTVEGVLKPLVRSVPGASVSNVPLVRA